jgi:drug/metabolite transporter (DMT)-like permease
VLDRVFAAWLLLSVIWGSTWIFIKIGVEEIPPLTYAWPRFVVALAGLVVLIVLRGSSFPRSIRDWGVMAVTGSLYFSLNYALVYWGETRISSGLAAVLFTTLPLFGLVIAHFWVPGDRMNPAKFGGVILGIGGVALIFYDQLSVSTTGAVWGVLAILIASLGCAVGGAIVKLKARHIDAIALTTGQMIIGIVPLILLGIATEGNPLSYHWSPMNITGLVYLGLVGSALTFVLLNWITKHMAVTKTQLIPFASTVFAVLLGWVVMGETMSWTAGLGMILILGGLLLAVRVSARPAVYGVAAASRDL